MTKEQINATLDAMLENPKAKTFLNHLVRAYIPTDVKKVTETPNGAFKCVLTKADLISEQEIEKASSSSAYQMAMKESTATTLDAKTSEALTKLMGNKELAVTGKETTTFMSVSANEAFAEWVIAKSRNADKHINWLLAGMRKAAFIKNSDSSEKKASKPKTATFALSDSSDVLSKLKAQLEAKGK